MGIVIFSLFFHLGPNTRLKTWKVHLGPNTRLKNWKPEKTISVLTLDWKTENLKSPSRSKNSIDKLKTWKFHLGPNTRLKNRKTEKSTSVQTLDWKTENLWNERGGSAQNHWVGLPCTVGSRQSSQSKQRQFSISLLDETTPWHPCLRDANIKRAFVLNCFLTPQPSWGLLSLGMKKLFRRYRSRFAEQKWLQVTVWRKGNRHERFVTCGLGEGGLG